MTWPTHRIQKYLKIKVSKDIFVSSFASKDTFYLFDRQAVMALIGYEQVPLQYIRKWPTPTQEIALFFHSSTRTSIACQKEKKRKEFESAACSVSVR